MAQYINDNNEYYDGISVVIGDTRYVSPSEELILQAGYHKVEEPQADPLELARGNKLMAIEDYDQSNNVNEFYLGGVPMWLDAPTRQQLRISIEAYQATGAETVTKWFGGQQFTFPTSAWLQMLNALEVYAAEALNVTEAHKAAVMAMDNVEDIEAYDITAAYPEKLNLTTEWLRSHT
jgi:hypothetical protein